MASGTAGYTVDTAQLATTETMLRGAADEAGRQLAALSHAAQHVVASWHGHAGTDFAAGWTEWHTAAATMIDALRDTGRALALSALDYQTTEDSVQSAVAGTAS